MEIGKQIKSKIDELIYTTEQTVELFEEYFNESYSYREDFIKEFVRRTENGIWIDFIRKKQFNLEDKDTHFELNISPRYHEIWDSVNKSDFHFFSDIDNKINYDKYAEEKWIDRKANEIIQIYDLIEASGHLIPKGRVQHNQNSSTLKKGLDSKEAILKIRPKEEFNDNEDFLDNLFSLLIRENILSDKTSVIQFKDIFNCENIHKSKSKFYFEADRVLLAFFLPKVFDRIFSGVNIAQMQSANCFFYDHDTPFTKAAMYNGKSQSKKFGSDEKYEDICKKILKEIKKLR